MEQGHIQFMDIRKFVAPGLLSTKTGCRSRPNC